MEALWSRSAFRKHIGNGRVSSVKDRSFHCFCFTSVQPCAALQVKQIWHPKLKSIPTTFHAHPTGQSCESPESKLPLQFELFLDTDSMPFIMFDV